MYLVNISAENLFQALSDTTRIRIMRLFVTFKAESCLCEVAEALDEPKYNISRHLKNLRQIGLLSSFKEGRWVYHKVINHQTYIKHLSALLKSLPDNTEVFDQDAKRFQEIIDTRNGSKCKGDNTTSSVKKKLVKMKMVSK